MRLRFTKMHGLGNDFVVLDGFTNTFSSGQIDFQRLADRRLGVGCDQVLLLQPSERADADARLRIFNADGTEAEHCGNGARCAADFLLRRGHARDGRVRLSAAAGMIEIYAESEGAYRVNMGTPDFRPEHVPLRAAGRSEHYILETASGTVAFHALSLGNPHAVISVPDTEAAPVPELGVALQESGLFARGVNVGFMQVIDPAHVRLRVYERGAGETLACGSGACAAVAAGRLYHGLDAEVDVGLKGGHLQVRWTGEGEPIWMTGPSTMVFEGSIEL